MSKNLSAKYYQKTKEIKIRYPNLSKEEKEKKNDNMVVNVTKISQTMKNKSLLSVEKKIL